jgi:phosphatidylglycerophosphatase A
MSNACFALGSCYYFRTQNHPALLGGNMDKTLVHALLGTWFGSGLIPSIHRRSMAGTYGSAVTVTLFWVLFPLLQKIDDWSTRGTLYAAILIVIYEIGVDVIPRTEVWLGFRLDWKGRWKNWDQNEIVIDEAFGVLIACAPIVFFGTQHWFLLSLGAFGLFRLFDITKALPLVRYFDRIHTPAAVMLDDGVAGAWAALFVAGFIWFFKL